MNTSVSKPYVEVGEFCGGGGGLGNWVPSSKFTSIWVSNGGGKPALPTLTSTTSTESLAHVCITNGKEDALCEMNQRFPIRAAKEDCFLSESLCKANGKVTNRFCSPSVKGGEFMLRARFPKQRIWGLPAKLFTPP